MVDITVTKDKCAKMLCLIASLYKEDMIIQEERSEMKCNTIINLYNIPSYAKIKLLQVSASLTHCLINIE